MNGKESRGSMVGALVLIAIGILVLLVQLQPDWFGEWLPALLLGGLGAIFLIAGMVTRESGFFVPGGILTGLGAGLAFVIGPLWAGRTDDSQMGGVFLLAFAAGWFLIPLFSIIFTHDRHWWALIPGVIIGFVGLAVYAGGAYMDVLTLVGKWWPLALIAGGIYALYKARGRGQAKEEEEPPAIEKHA